MNMPIAIVIPMVVAALLAAFGIGYIFGLGLR